MSSGGGPHRPWPSRPVAPASLRRFLPQSGTFSNDEAPATPAPSSSQTQPPAIPHSPAHFLSPQTLWSPFSDTSFPVTQPQPSTVPTPTPFPDRLDNEFLPTAEQIVHEGFIPAPGRENDDDPIFPDHSHDPFQSSEEDESDVERMLEEIGEKNDDEEVDQDYSDSENELEDDPDEILLEGELDEDEEDSVPKRGKPKDKAARGGARGRPSTRARGGLRGGSSRGRKTGVRGRKKGTRGPRIVADPGPEFKRILQLANEAYMKKDYRMAIHHASEAIRINPEIFSAFNILSEAYAAMDDDPKSIDALIMGAHVKRDRDLWWLIIERIENIDTNKYPKYNELTKTEWCLRCLRSTISLDPNDYHARSRKLALESERGNISKCVKLCQTMLKMKGHEHEYDLLRQMAVLGTSSPKQTKIHLEKILSFFDDSVAHFVKNDDPTLDWNLLNIYLDLLDRAGDYNYALARLKTLCRWKQGRKHETFWDKEKDDREFDIEDVPRRIAVPHFSRMGNRHDYGGTLPMEIRAKMGIFRLRQKPSNLDEAMHHLNMLEPEDESPYSYLQDYPDIFREVADTLHTTGHDQEALYFYEPLLRHKPGEFTLKSLIGMHTCYKNRKDSENGEKIIELLKEWNAVSLDDLAILTKFFEDAGLPYEARRRAEVVYNNKGGWRLRKVRYEGYTALLEHFKEERKKQRGKGNVRKIRAKKYKKKLKVATGAAEEDTDNEQAAPKERPSLGPLDKRPAKGRGLYRKKNQQIRPQPQIFLPVEATDGPQEQPGSGSPPPPDFLEGTGVSVDKIEHRFFRDKLTKLAAEHADELSSKRAQQREIAASFKRLDELSELADDGDEESVAEYLSISRELVEEFSTFDLFYSERKHEFKGYFRRVAKGELWTESALMALAVEANQVEDGQEARNLEEKPTDVNQEFWGIHFDKWADVFGRYALYLARKGEKERCFSAIDVAMQSNIMYRSKTYSHQLELCRLASALAIDDSEQVSTAVRVLLRKHPFSGDLIRLYSAANRLCSISDGYGDGPAHKAFLRFIKTIDYVLLKPSERTWFNFRGDDRSQWMQAVVNSGMLDYVKGHDPALFALYGHVLVSGGSYMGALNYYFRAYALVPDDPIINLSIGLAYLQHAMKRQSENRQYQIQQGVSFMIRYYELRTKDDVAVHRSEAEFNMGRMWHGLGLVTQALQAYERCIGLRQRVRSEAGDRCKDGEVEDFASEAAFAMQTIYTLSGDFTGASKVTEEVLVIE